MNLQKKFKSGFIAIIGSPNVGKSTFINTIIGQKISIISDKPQTTRNKIIAILHRDSSQMIFLDTPGVHNSSKKINKKMLETSFSAIDDVDIVCMMIDVAKSDPVSESLLIENFKKRTKPVIIALNKIDLIQKAKLLPIIDHWNKIYPFNAILPVSCLKSYNLDSLISEMEKLLPAGPPYFSEDNITDMPEKFIAAEIIREKIFLFTSQEIPYSTAVTIESFKENKIKNIVKINAIIHVERDSQKGIIIGKNGLKLKKIGKESRRDIEKMTGIKVFLSLFVRVQKNWTQDYDSLQKFGY